MKDFRCAICNYSTFISSNYYKHLRTLKHKRNFDNSQILKQNMVSKNDLTTNDHILTTNDHNLTTNDHNLTTNENQSIDGVVCNYCNKKLSTKGHLKRHIKKYCTEYKKIDSTKILESKIDNFNKLIKLQECKHQKEKKELYKQMEMLLEKVGNTTNIQNNITLNTYGKEDLSHISDNFKDEMLKVPYYMIPKMVEAVHFNQNKPENKNIVLPNKKENKIKVWSGDKWLWKNKDETLSALVDGKYYILESHFDEVSSNLSPFIKTNFLKFKDYFNDNDKCMVEELKKKSDLILLNNK